MIENLQAHYGFSVMPFGSAIPVAALWGAPSLPDCGPPVGSIRKGWL